IRHLHVTGVQTCALPIFGQHCCQEPESIPPTNAGLEMSVPQVNSTTSSPTNTAIRLLTVQLVIAYMIAQRLARKIADKHVSDREDRKSVGWARSGRPGRK